MLVGVVDIGRYGVWMVVLVWNASYIALVYTLERKLLSIPLRELQPHHSEWCGLCIVHKWHLVVAVELTT